MWHVWLCIFLGGRVYSIIKYGFRFTEDSSFRFTRQIEWTFHRESSPESLIEYRLIVRHI